MPGLRLSAQAYILAVGAVGAALLAGVLARQPLLVDAAVLPTALLMLVINFASEQYVIKLPRGSGELAASTISQIAGIFILPLPLLLLITAVGTIAQDVFSRKAWYKALFNAGQMLLAVGIPGLVIHAVNSPQHLFASGNAAIGMPLAIAVVVLYYGVNTMLTYTVLALEWRSSLWSVWLENTGTGVLIEFGMGIIGVLWAYMWLQDPLWSTLAIWPAVMACGAFHHIRRLESGNEQGILSIAETIDARDPYTFQHSKRVAEFVEKIAKAMKLDTPHIRVLTSAAKLHDLGKMGIGDEVLRKPGKLDEKDWAMMRRHPEIGATILARYHLFKDRVDVILNHHERYDGKGYPRGVRGESIPLGARIIAVADSFEAMTSDRPYRRALSQEIAIEELKKGMGTQFDPMVVASFLTVLEHERTGHNLRRFAEQLRTTGHRTKKEEHPVDDTAPQIA